MMEFEAESELAQKTEIFKIAITGVSQQLGGKAND